MGLMSKVNVYWEV